MAPDVDSVMKAIAEAVLDGHPDAAMRLLEDLIYDLDQHKQAEVYLAERPVRGSAGFAAMIGSNRGEG